MAVLSFDHVNKIYPSGFQAVRDFQLEIAEHECVVLTGPSGCGKSTVLRMVSGQEPVTSGTVKLSGRVINDMDPKDRDVAIVFQNSGIYRHMTVYDNMAFELKLRRVKRGGTDSESGTFAGTEAWRAVWRAGTEDAAGESGRPSAEGVSDG